MTVLFMDSFDHYTSIGNKWTNNSVLVTPTITAGIGRYGTAGLTNDYSGGSNANMIISRYLPSTYNTLIMGFGFRTDVLKEDTNWGRDCVAFQLNGAAQYCMTINNAGQIQVRRGTWNSTVVATSAAVISINTQYYIEFKVYIHDTAGTYEVRVNGTNVLSNTSQDTKAQSGSGANQIYVRGYAFIKYDRWDDIYVCDTTGSIANDFLGDCRVEAKLPSGAGNSTDWTPSTGSNYQCVDESAPNGDTDYVSNRTVGDHDTYAFADLSTSEGVVYAVQTNMSAKKSSAGSRQVKMVVRSNGSDYATGTAHVLGDNYVYLSDIYEADPDTSSAWTIAGVNAAEFGPKTEA